MKSLNTCNMLGFVLFQTSICVLIEFCFLGGGEASLFTFLFILGRLEKESAEKGEKLNKIKMVAVKAKKELDASRKEVL